mgnify:CR=1 FL=1
MWIPLSGFRYVEAPPLLFYIKGPSDSQTSKTNDRRPSRSKKNVRPTQVQLQAILLFSLRDVTSKYFGRKVEQEV